MHRTTSTPRTPNPDVDKGESSAPRKSTVIRLRSTQRRSTRLTPPTPIPTTAKADDIFLQDTIQLSLAEQKSHDELKAKQNVDSSTLRQNDNQNDLDTRLEPRNNKESLKVEITNEVQPINVNEEEEESAEDDYKLKRREKGKNVEEFRHTPPPTTIRSPRIHSTRIPSNTEKLQELTGTDPKPSSSTPSSSSPKPKLYASQHIFSLFKPNTRRFKCYKSFFIELQGCYGYFFEHLNTRFMPRKKFHVLTQYLQEVMEESLPKMVDARVQELTKTQVPVYVAQGLIMERQHNQVDVAKMITDVIQQDRENLRAEISLQISNAITNHIPSQVDSSVRNYMSGHILHVNPTQASPTSTQEQQYQLYLTMKDNPRLQQDDLPIWLAHKYKFERLHVSNTPCPSTSGNQEQLDDFDFWTDSYATDDDELSIKKVSQELVEEMSQTVDEIQIFLKNDIVWESRKEILVSPYLQKPTTVIQSCQRDPKAPALSLFPAVIFPDDDIEERTSRWVDKYVKKFNHYARYNYKNVNKNDIKDMYLLIVNGKLGVESYQQKVNLNAPTIIFPCIEKYKVLSIVSEPVYDIIYKNNKKEKRVMRHQEVHKFCDATLKIVLEGLKSYNNNVKHGYVTPSLSKEDVEYLSLSIAYSLTINFANVSSLPVADNVDGADSFFLALSLPIGRETFATSSSSLSLASKLQIKTTLP
ncbi:hypothetical protein Tco_1313039 [Tanacetum coccineum]